ncbi:DsbA family oxidoreductase [Acinetobacter sp. ANC 4654]|uniref:DsbA family oxidoreductase n=1 Tax=Acinetobacter sp. ANC 4654 TaxID=1977872 RepID=UPI000A32C92F|nr:DsbA family oxidoreductase [Acinetobacter sp. ANC 4654]
MTREINIEVFFDFICPWCMIGKRQLQVAIQKLRHSHPDVIVKLQWKGVQLLPHIPVDGIPFHAFYLQRLGSMTAVRMRQAQVRQAAKAVSIHLDFDRIPRMPNTAKAHSFYANARKISDAAQSDRLLEGLYSAYFHHSENISDTEVLRKIATYCGLSEEVIDEIIEKPHTPFFNTDTGGKGVPYFVFDRSFAMVGAQPADELYQAMLDALLVERREIA